MITMSGRLAGALLLSLLLVSSYSPTRAADGVYDLSLEEAVTTAVRNNFDIALEKIQTQVAHEQSSIAEAEFDPSLNSEVSYGKSRTASTSAFANPEISQTDQAGGDVYVSEKTTAGTQYKAGLSMRQDSTNSTFQNLNPAYNASLKMELTQPLLRNRGAEVNRWMIVTSRNNEDIAKYRLTEKLSAIITAVHETYWELAFSVESLKAQKESLERAKDLERRVRIQVDVGALSPIEIVQAQASVAERERNVIQADNAVDKASDQLLKLMNPKASDDIWQKRVNTTDLPKVSSLPMGVDRSIEKALESRPEIKIAKKEQENSNIELVYRKNQKWPSLDIVASLNLNGVRGEAQPTTSFSSGGVKYSSFDGGWDSAFGDATSGNYYDYSLGLRLTYPIGAREPKAREAIAALSVQSAIIKLKSLENDIILEVRDAAREIENGKKQVEAARLARVLAEKKLEAEVKKFEVGASTSFNVLEYQKDLINQQSEELRALTESRKAVARYYRAIGSALEFNNIDYN